MSFKKLQLTVAQVSKFQPKLNKSPITDVTALSGGEWSQAFGFIQDNKHYVLRLSPNQDDFLIDSFANRFNSAALPIPKIVELGKAFDSYYAVSDRAFGIMIDDLDKLSMQRIIPSLFATLDAIRESDISDTTGYGMLDVQGTGSKQSWKDFLLEVASDEPNRKIFGWRKGLQTSPLGDGPFNQAYALLVKQAADLPEVRYLIHNDLMNFNVLTSDDHITAVFDWANAAYGDFLYDLANIAFWGPLYEPIKGIDWVAEAQAHYQKIGLDVPQLQKRLRCCMLRIGLDAQTYYGYTRNWEWLEPVTARTFEVAEG